MNLVSLIIMRLKIIGWLLSAPSLSIEIGRITGKIIRLNLNVKKQKKQKKRDIQVKKYQNKLFGCYGVRINKTPILARTIKPLNLTIKPDTHLSENY